ncbi:MAG: hypothetical protein E7254_12305 [Lachnospiraceae bacterium]|nr:hypothetical protein [Lachnospiraceae bacterium]
MSIYSARKKHLIVLGGLLLLLTCKNGLYYRIPENSYKVSQEAVEIVEIMDENKLGDDKSIPIAYLCPITSNLTSNMTHYDEVYYGLSSYTSRYYVLITLGNIDKIKAGYDLPYVVICKDDDTLWLEKNGYILEGETETTKVYKHYTIE